MYENEKKVITDEVVIDEDRVIAGEPKAKLMGADQTVYGVYQIPHNPTPEQEKRIIDEGVRFIMGD